MDFILETQNLSKKFGGLVAVDKVGLRLRAGELRCIIGPNGCGKTTLFNLISGHFKPTSGSVFFNQHEITGRAVHEISRMGIGRKFQVPSIFEGLTVFENMRIPSLSHHNPSLRKALTPDCRSREKILSQLERIDLADQANELATNLSHGQKQWLEIGMVLASEPKLMLLDEPTAGMTIVETRRTAELIKKISRESGVGILVIEHDLSFVQDIASRVTVLYKGSVFREGSYEEIQSDEEIHKIYLGRRT